MSIYACPQCGAPVRGTLRVAYLGESRGVILSCCGTWLSKAFLSDRYGVDMPEPSTVLRFDESERADREWVPNDADRSPQERAEAFFASVPEPTESVEEIIETARRDSKFGWMSGAEPEED